MVVKRSIKRVEVSFTTRKCGAEKLEDITGTYFPKAKEYRSLEDAQRFGTLYEWADRYAKLTALAVAAKHLGVDAPKDISITDIEGNTFCIDNIQGIAIDPKQEISIPSDVRANIEVILRKIDENRDDVDYMSELKSELDRVLSRNDLSKDDIRDLIENAGVEDVL